MADRRKLQKEIDMCIKKVQDGVDEFNEVWDKLQAAANQNQKEKKEEELKKVIKKLQRLRDQIKAWQQSKVVKDESVLLEYRQLIERQMERFKVVERETKTKAYSKEGLAGPATKDPAQKEKEECNNWMHTSLVSLQQQIEQLEAEIENLGRKKKQSRNDQEMVEDLEAKLERHKYYTTNLETLMRLLYNDKISADKINDVRDHVEYYVDNNDEDETLYLDEAEIFCDFELEKEQEVLGIAAPIPENLNNESSSIKSDEKEEKDEIPPSPGSNKVRDRKLSDNSDKLHDDSEQNCSSERRRNKSSGNSDRGSVSDLPKSVSSVSTTSTVPPGSSTTPEVSSESPRKAAKVPASFPGLPASTPAKPTSVANFANVARTTQPIATPKETRNTSSPMGAWDRGHPGSVGSSTDLSQELSQLQLTSNDHMMPNIQPTTNEQIMPQSQQSPQQQHQQQQSHQQQLQPTQQFEPLQNHIQHPDDIFSEAKVNIDPLLSSSLAPNGQFDPELSFQSFQTEARINQEPLKEVYIEDLTNTIPISSQVQHEQDIQRNAVEAAFKHLPLLSDSEKPRNYLYRQPSNQLLQPNQRYFPKNCLRDMHTPDFFMKLATETLFYIFYYMEGTRAQYLAAVTLKKQSWRFHTKYMMWFQRHEEPKTINEEYEQGTYIYFDYERWAQRRKDGFTFEYRYLEDRELPLTH